MKNLSVKLGVGYVFVKRKDETMLVLSAVLTTVAMLLVVALVPQLVPLVGQR